MDEGIQHTLFPLFHKMQGKKILIVGGGKVAERKIRQLLPYNPAITLVAPETIGAISEFAAEGKIQMHKRGYQPGEAPKYDLVIAATDDNRINRQVRDDTSSAGILLNAVDIPELCDVYFGSVIRKGDLVFAIGSGGNAPFFTRAIRKKLESLLPEGLSEMSRMAGIFREWLMNTTSDPAEKERLIDGFMAEIENKWQIWSHDIEQAKNEWRNL